MEKKKKTVKAGRVFVTTVEDGQGKRIYVSDVDSCNPLTVATTKGGVDALVEVLKEASLELYGE